MGGNRGGFSGQRGSWKHTGGRSKSHGNGGFNNSNQGNYSGNQNYSQGSFNNQQGRTRSNSQGQGTINYFLKNMLYHGSFKQSQSCFLVQNAGPRGKKPANRSRNALKNDKKNVKKMNFQIHPNVPYRMYHSNPDNNDDFLNRTLQSGANHMAIPLRPKIFENSVAFYCDSIGIKHSAVELNYNNDNSIYSMVFSYKYDLLRFIWRFGHLADETSFYFKLRDCRFITGHFSMARDGSVFYLNSTRDEWWSFLRYADALNADLERRQDEWSRRPTQDEFNNGKKSLKEVMNFHKVNMKFTDFAQSTVQIWQNNSCSYDRNYLPLSDRGTDEVKVIHKKITIAIDGQSFTIHENDYEAMQQRRRDENKAKSNASKTKEEKPALSIIALANKHHVVQDKVIKKGTKIDIITNKADYISKIFSFLNFENPIFLAFLHQWYSETYVFLEKYFPKILPQLENCELKDKIQIILLEFATVPKKPKALPGTDPRYSRSMSTMIDISNAMYNQVQRTELINKELKSTKTTMSNYLNSAAIGFDQINKEHINNMQRVNELVQWANQVSTQVENAPMLHVPDTHQRVCQTLEHNIENSQRRTFKQLQFPLSNVPNNEIEDTPNQEPESGQRCDVFKPWDNIFKKLGLVINEHIETIFSTKDINVKNSLKSFDNSSEGVPSNRHHGIVELNDGSPEIKRLKPSDESNGLMELDTTLTPFNTSNSSNNTVVDNPNFAGSQPTLHHGMVPQGETQDTHWINSSGSIIYDCWAKSAGARTSVTSVNQTTLAVLGQSKDQSQAYYWMMCMFCHELLNHINLVCANYQSYADSTRLSLEVWQEYQHRVAVWQEALFSQTYYIESTQHNAHAALMPPLKHREIFDVLVNLVNSCKDNRAKGGKVQITHVQALVYKCSHIGVGSVGVTTASQNPMMQNPMTQNQNPMDQVPITNEPQSQTQWLVNSNVENISSSFSDKNSIKNNKKNNDKFQHNKKVSVSLKNETIKENPRTKIPLSLRSPKDLISSDPFYDAAFDAQNISCNEDFTFSEDSFECLRSENSLESDLDLDFQNATLKEFQDWFFARNIFKVPIGGKYFFINTITDRETMQFIFHVHNQRFKTDEMLFQTVSRIHRPKIHKTVVIPKLYRKSHWYEKTTAYPLISEPPRKEFLPKANNIKTVFNMPDPKPLNQNKPMKCPNFQTHNPLQQASLSIININIDRCNALKLERLVKDRHEVGIFCLNELSIHSADVEAMTPAGYKLYVGKADLDQRIYTAILCKEELSQCITQVQCTFPMFCKIKLIKDKFQCFITSVYRPPDGSVKYSKSNLPRHQFFDELKKVSKVAERFSSIVAGDFNVQFSGKINKKRLELVHKAVAGHKNLVKNNFDIMIKPNR